MVTKHTNYQKISAATIVSFAVLLIGSAHAHAGSVIVNTMLDRFGGAVMGLSGLQVQVTYHADVRDLTTGAILASGSTVPTGTDLLFTCGEHRYEDIYWFASGYNADSPYGDWTEGAARPVGDLCVEKNYVPFDGRTEGHQGRTYATFSVDPPVSSISGLPATCTTHTDGVSKVCRDVEPGTLSGTCSYQPTNGIFYGVNGLLKQGGGYRGASVAATCTNQTSPSISGSVPVPTASLTHTITVSNTLADSTNTPTAPTVTTAGSSCTLESPYTIQMQATDPNGDSWNDTQSPVGGESSSPITEETIYTLRCLDTSGTEYTQTARVNVLPLWSEF